MIFSEYGPEHSEAAFCGNEHSLASPFYLCPAASGHSINILSMIAQLQNVGLMNRSLVSGLNHGVGWLCLSFV